MPTPLFSPEEQQQIIQAIKDAEKNTSGEVKVHVEKFCKPKDALLRSKQVFAKLNLHETKLRNAVLFYLAIEDHKFAIWGDDGINRAVPNGFWDEIKDKMRSLFVEKKLVEGLCEGIEMAGEALKTHFPYRSDDINEISDDISFGSE